MNPTRKPTKTCVNGGVLVRFTYNDERGLILESDHGISNTPRSKRFRTRAKNANHKTGCHQGVTTGYGPESGNYAHSPTCLLAGRRGHAHGPAGRDRCEGHTRPRPPPRRAEGGAMNPPDEQDEAAFRARMRAVIQENLEDQAEPAPAPKTAWEYRAESLSRHSLQGGRERLRIAARRRLAGVCRHEGPDVLGCRHPADRRRAYRLGTGAAPITRRTWAKWTASSRAAVPRPVSRSRAGPFTRFDLVNSGPTSSVAPSPIGTWRTALTVGECRAVVSRRMPHCGGPAE